MADKNSYPQIPSTVWWGVRASLNRSPNAAIDERVLGIQLGVQETAARQYIVELKRAGILNEDNKATPLAHKWRMDETYWEAVQELLARVYPESLMQVAPPGDADRQKAISWFTREGLGIGTAGNKAATYLLLSSRTPNEAPTRGGSPRPTPEERKSANGGEKTRTLPRKTEVTKGGQRTQFVSPADDKKKSELIPLNVNVQIHISADASTDQIESIFSAMRKYLYSDAS